ncbi:RNA-directed DNA polymerase from mobile element jockey [Aphis craccivora]|uniref:RNA-directed DNA polymerase from mobile element jockey n=1 Tax=Aphis craccivora TaxID=307492 RepID=A0A6G0Z1Y3_APHCR|nr:RNA-directed DNA polymerase from mobile element jockey [Aphis craccivora]
MSFFRSRCPFEFDYNINGSKLTRAANTFKDLGIVFDTKLTFYPHIKASCCKALKIPGFVKRVCTQFKLVAPIKSLYCALVCSVLEYASVTCDPHTISHSYALERVQCKFLSFASYVLEINHPPYDYIPVLASLKLSLLADRRVRANISFLSKLISGLIDPPIPSPMH